VGLENGLLADIPHDRKARVGGKSLRLPSAEQFADILGNIESSGAWCAYDAADLVRFLAYSGCRISEVANVKRDDVDLRAGTIRISGDPVHGTKNSESRTIPINPAMHDLCAR
jgi:integrase